MATKKFIIEVEEGNTLCSECPFKTIDCSVWRCGDLNCCKYNLATIKIKELEELK